SAYRLSIIILQSYPLNSNHSVRLKLSTHFAHPLFRARDCMTIDEDNWRSLCDSKTLLPSPRIADLFFQKFIFEHFREAHSSLSGFNCGLSKSLIKGLLTWLLIRFLHPRSCQIVESRGKTVYIF